ncbi:MAG: exodeoxyribonuclease VII small subunit [Ignavibacteriaceae bacterium]|nr:exodeoxyribonuclease VII small subunit [Ignavibacteriaceae bacterium]
MKKKNTLSFEKKIMRLEEISDLLEAEDTQLEDAIKFFEEGIELSKECLISLKSAELKITELKKKIDSINISSKEAGRKNTGGENS